MIYRYIVLIRALCRGGAEGAPTGAPTPPPPEGAPTGQFGAPRGQKRRRCEPLSARRPRHGPRSRWPRTRSAAQHSTAQHSRAQHSTAQPLGVPSTTRWTSTHGWDPACSTRLSPGGTRWRDFPLRAWLRPCRRSGCREHTVPAYGALTAPPAGEWSALAALSGAPAASSGPVAAPAPAAGHTIE